MRTLSVTVTVSPLATGDPSTCIDTVSTGGLAALGVQFKENEVPVVWSAVGLRGNGSSGGSIGRRRCVDLLHIVIWLECNYDKSWEGNSHCTSRVKLAAPLPASL